MTHATIELRVRRDDGACTDVLSGHPCGALFFVLGLLFHRPARGIRFSLREQSCKELLLSPVIWKMPCYLLPP